MAMQWDKIEAAHKKLQPLIKKIDSSLAEKLIKQIKSSLDTAWDAEDDYAKAVKAAQDGGNTGKKPADYGADKDCKATLAALKKAAGIHLDEVKTLRKISKQAEAPFKELTKLLAEAKKQATKGNKEQARFQATLKVDHEKVQIAAEAVGKLTVPQLFYGAQINKILDRVINKSGGGGSALPKDAAKLIEPKERDKNVKMAVKQAKQVAKLCDGALKKADPDPKAADPYLKKATALIKNLKALDSAYQGVKKKAADMIKKSKDKSKITRAILTIAKAHDVSASKFSETREAIGKLS